MKFYLEDITKISSEAIVNASDKKLSGGGGIDKAIHIAAGREKLKNALKDKSIETGEAIITPGFKLPAEYIIHTAGPRYKDGTKGEDKLLSRAYESCLDVAKEHKIKSITFCSLSTGTFRYPLEQASQIAIETILRWINENKSKMEVSFAFMDVKTKKAYERAFSELTETKGEVIIKEKFKTQFMVGQEITHKKFGEGKIIAIKEKDDDCILDVKFNNDIKSISEKACTQLKLINGGLYE